MGKIRDNPKYAKIFEWGKLISITGTAQIIVQACSLIGGILIIRFLPTKEYALYTIANTMLGTMSILSDSGISTGVMGIGGKVWQDKKQLGVVLATGLKLREKFAIASLIVSIPILLYLLLHNGASWITAIIIAAALIPAFLSALSDSLLETIPKLHQMIVPLQKNQISVSIFRLVLSSASLFLFPFTYIALLAAGIPRMYGNFKLRKIVYGVLDKEMPDESVKKEMMFIVRRFMPGVIYFCISGQLTIFLISIIGKTQSVAQVGALSRLSMVLTLFTVLFSTLVIPRFSRLPEARAIVLKRFIQILLLCCALAVVTVFVTWILGSQILLVLGQKYLGLEYELVLSITGSCLSLIVGVVLGSYNSRGWVLHPAISVTVEIVALAFGLYFIDYSTLQGVLILNLFLASIQVFTHVIFTFYKIITMKKLTLI